MATPFMENGIARLLDVVRPGMLCAFDFDGTLAPIVDDPAAARIPPPVLRRLAALAEFTPVAIITGRSVEDVSFRLDFFPDFVIGNHGVEGLPDQERNEERYRRTCSHWVHSLQRVLKSEDVEPAVWIEDKVYSLSVHYRQARNPAAVERKLRKLIERTLPAAKVVEGKFVFNLVHADAPDKGHALRILREHIGASSALYIGDDVTDETVFMLPHGDLLTIRVGNDARTAAEFYLPDASATLPFIDVLLKRLSEMLRPEGNAHAPLPQ